MKRILWAVGMGIIGLYLGLKGQDIKINGLEVAVGVLWAATIGFGLGSIFDRRARGKKLIVYWAVTLALTASFFGPLIPVSSFAARETAAFVLGTLIGVITGVVHLKIGPRELRS